MKHYIVPIFITILGLITAYMFYAFWHTEEINPPKQITKKTQEKVNEDLSTHEVIPRSTLIVPDEVPTSTSAMAEQEKKELEAMMAEADKIVALTPQQMDKQTQAIYESLIPENHEETMEAAAEAFEELDSYVAALDSRLAEEMADVEASMQEGQEVIEDMSHQEPEELPIIEEEIIVEEPE